jgi:hypothetical protein
VAFSSRENSSDGGKTRQNLCCENLRSGKVGVSSDFWILNDFVFNNLTFGSTPATRWPEKALTRENFGKLLLFSSLEALGRFSDFQLNDVYVLRTVEDSARQQTFQEHTHPAKRDTKSE